jgi:hypothetical protein
MALKAPGILVFLLSIVLALAVLFAKFFGATVPLLTQETTQFYGLLAAYVVLLLGCIMRGAKICVLLSRGQRCSGAAPGASILMCDGNASHRLPLDRSAPCTTPEPGNLAGYRAHARCRGLHRRGDERHR